MWAEVWTLPELGSFAVLESTIPGVVKVQDKHTGIGRGSVTIPADWSGISSILSASAGSLIRVFRRDATGGRVCVFEFIPETMNKQYGEIKTVTVTGPSIEAKLDQAVVLTHDWPTNPTVDPNWNWGFTSLLATQNQGFEANPYSLINPGAEDGTTNGWPTTGTRRDAIAPETFEAIEDAGDADDGEGFSARGDGPGCGTGAPVWGRSTCFPSGRG